MMQFAFDFDVAPAAPVPRRPTAKELKAEAAARAEDDHARNRARQRLELEQARAHWRVGMVTSLPIFATVMDSDQRYTQMLPGVVEAIEGDHASVRIYAAPEYGYTIDNYPLHRKLAVEVPLTDLGVHHWNQDLERLVAEDRLEHGDADLGQRTLERTNYQRWA